VDEIRVLIADDQALFRGGLAMLLGVQPGIAVVGEAADGEEALRLAATSRPDVVLMDLRMPVLDGVAAIARLREQLPALPVVALTTFDDEATLLAALRAGAAGFLVKDVRAETLMEAIAAVARGESYLHSKVTAKVLAELRRLAEGKPAGGAEPLALSPRERDVLTELAAGASNKEIGKRLHLAEGTVKNHVTSLLAKLGASDRTQAALRAHELGLIG